MNGGEWSEVGALTNLQRRCDAHAMMHGASRVIALRERRRQNGGKRSFEEFYCDLRQKKSREPSVGAAEPVSAREPPFGQFLTCSALYLRFPSHAKDRFNRPTRFCHTVRVSHTTS